MPPTLALFISLLITLAGCDLLRQDDPYKPLPPGRRDYVWKVDSVYSAPSGFLNDMWGSSPNDVWAVSPGGLENLWHYDGINWSPYSQHLAGSLFSVFGFSQKNVWFGGNDGRILHFDGTKISNSFQYKPQSEINSIWGIAPDNVYATGYVLGPEGLNSFLLHFNGQRWKDILTDTSGSEFFGVRQHKRNLYLWGTKANQSTTAYYVANTSESARVIELMSGGLDSFGYGALNLIQNSLYLSVRNDVYKFDHTYPDLKSVNLQKITPVLAPDLLYHVFGRHSQDLFLCTKEGLAHFNGTNNEYLIRFDNSRTYPTGNMVVFEKDVFLLTNDYENGTNLIYHGKMNDFSTKDSQR